MQALTWRGVNPNQLSVVAIGKAQPIAPNADPAGRARNRRVEFMISGSEAANLSVVSHRRVNRDFFRTPTNVAAVPPPPQVAVLKLSSLTPAKGNSVESLTQTQTLSLPPPVKRVEVAVAMANPQSSQWTDAPFDSDEKTNPPGSKWVDAP
jgi:hypothetical protein